MIPQSRVMGSYRRLLYAERAVQRLQTRPGSLQISFAARRHNATEANPPPPKRPPPAPQAKPLSTFQTTLIGVSALTLAGLAYVCYEFVFHKPTMFPKAVDKPLRAALLAVEKAEYEESEAHFRRAYEALKTVPREELMPSPDLKISGVVVAYGEVLERTGQLQKAYDLYTEYLEELKLNLLPGEIEPERLRAASISLRIGQIAERLNNRDSEESHKVWALEETLRMVAQFNGLQQPGAGGVPPMDVRTIQLPSFIQRDQLGALIEEVGRMYTDRRKAEYAMPLHLQALSLLLPNSQATVQPGKRCHAASTMNNIATTIANHSTSKEALDQARQWESEGLGQIERALKEIGTIHAGLENEQYIKARVADVCYAHMVSVLLNLATIEQLDGKPDVARMHIQKALDTATQEGFTPGVTAAHKHLEDLNANRTLSLT